MSSNEEHELTRAKRIERQQHYRAELERLRGRRARANSPATRAKLDARIRVIEGRLSRA